MKKMTAVLKFAALLALTLETSVGASGQASTAKTLDFPGAVFTVARAINVNGDTVGWYIGGGRHGFLLTNGRYTQVDVPASWNALGTTALGINDSGMIVGSYFTIDSDGNLHQHGYCKSGEMFIKLDVPGATDTIPRSISSANVAGFYFDQAGNEHGFVGMNAGAVTIDVPGALGTQAAGINNNGDITGSYLDSSGNVRSFVRIGSSGTVSTFAVPGAAGQLAGTEAFAINDAGQVGGFDAKSKSLAPGGEPPADLHGFVMTNGKSVQVNFPDGINTCIFGLNNAEDAVGQYDTTDGATHGFLLGLAQVE